LNESSFRLGKFENALGLEVLGAPAYLLKPRKVLPEVKCVGMLSFSAT
jgi:hypothetical protein